MYTSGPFGWKKMEWNNIVIKSDSNISQPMQSEIEVRLKAGYMCMYFSYTTVHVSVFISIHWLGKVSLRSFLRSRLGAWVSPLLISTNEKLACSKSRNCINSTKLYYLQHKFHLRKPVTYLTEAAIMLLGPSACSPQLNLCSVCLNLHDCKTETNLHEIQPVWILITCNNEILWSQENR